MEQEREQKREREREQGQGLHRWDRIGRGAAYGSALVLSPYLLIKVSWVLGALIGVLPTGKGFSRSGWVLFNTVTVGMAAIGIVLALALVRPWGRRLPARAVVFSAWIGSGFLVSVLPFALYSVLASPTGSTQDSGGGDPALPGWEALLLQVSFAGMGLGLALALPAYFRRRWPHAFRKRDAGQRADLHGEDRPGRAVTWAPLLAALVGAYWLYWTLGGTLGLARPAVRDSTWYLLTGLGGVWALLGAAGALSLARDRPHGLPRAVPLALCWLGSGSLCAWSGWKLPVLLIARLADPTAPAPPGHLAAGSLLNLAAVLAGAGMLRGLVRTPAPRHPLESGSDTTGRQRGRWVPRAR